MKKFSILALAALLVVAFTVPATALENEFGGYWRTRFFSQKYFSGYDRGDDTGLPAPVDEASDDTTERVDTRTRLYYTAKINDNLKFVNKFEYDAVWGDPDTYGRPGADDVAVEVKNSYVDFNLGPVNTTVGAQPYKLFRGFAIDDDASGIIARWKAMDNFILAGSWLKNYEGDGGDEENEDLDTYTITGAFWFTENIKLQPSVSYARTDEVNALTASVVRFADPATAVFFDSADDAYIVTYGLDFDMTFEKWGLWVTAFGQYGEISDATLTDGVTLFVDDDDIDVEAYLFAVGGNVMAGPVDIHGEFFYASGDDDPADDDLEAVVAPIGSYYWSEIMGLGIFDNEASAGSPGDKITNIWAANIGASMKPMDKLKIAVDVWYAELVEDDLNLNNLTEEDTLGTEVDVMITYELVEGLNLDLVGAYLFADDATADAVEDNEEDPYEFGARLSLSF